MNIRLLQGDQASQLLSEESFLATWRELLARCPWATGFQSPEFVNTWYLHYREQYEPIVLMGCNDDDSCAGLFMLARQRGSNTVVPAGSWQAEYQSWIASEQTGDDFILKALQTLDEALRLPSLVLRYVPAGAPMRWLQESAIRSRAHVQAFRRPLMDLNEEGIRGSLRNSGNKRRLKQLRAHGELRLEQFKCPDDLLKHMDRIETFHDLRHAEVRGSCPFQNDPFKRTFHMALMNHPALVHCVAMMAGDEMVSAHFGIRTGAQLQLGLLSHHPGFAVTSPGKILMYLLGLMLLEQGVSQIDLTAGGEAYKERFANAWDTVYVVNVHASHSRRRIAELKSSATGLLRRGLTQAGVSVHAASAATDLFPRNRRSSVLQKVTTYDLKAHAMVLELPDTIEAPTVDRDVQVDAFSELLRDGAHHSRWTRRKTFSAVVGRFERGEHSFSISRNGALGHIAWLREKLSKEDVAQLPMIREPAALLSQVCTARGLPAEEMVRQSISAVRRWLTLRRPGVRLYAVVERQDHQNLFALQRYGFNEVGTVAAPPPVKITTTTAGDENGSRTNLHKPAPTGGRGFAAQVPASKPGSPSTQALPPVVLLGGEANALSVARDLGRMGVKVYGIGEVDSFVRFSRFCHWINVPGCGTTEKSWANYLLGDESKWLEGAILLSCSDAGLQVLIRHRERLQQRYQLDESHPPAQEMMLDKLTTYRAAAAAGVATPRFWEVASADELEHSREQLVFPLLVKPRLSHLFERQFGRKHVIVESMESLNRVLKQAAEGRLEVLLMEWIPGGDDALCSYFTYLDEKSKPQLHFTKRIIRRFPPGMGGACYHITDWIPELIEPANRLFASVGLRGLANVEFKRDPRDGVYKLIECNARFTASNCLVSASGVHLAEYVYRRLAKLPQIQPPEKGGYRLGLRLWDPARDFSSMRRLRAAKEISVIAWLKSIAHRQTLQYFEWTDPLPAMGRALRPWLRRLASVRSATNGSAASKAEIMADGRQP